MVLNNIDLHILFKGSIEICLIKAMVVNPYPIPLFYMYLTLSFLTLGMPVDQLCLRCKEVLASFRCQLCGPCGFYCWECFEACHNHTNLFHVVEKWEVNL